MAYERRDFAGAAPATTLTGPINNSVTSLTLTDGTGYPTGANGPFFLVISPGLSTEEKVKCTARSGTSVTGVTRGADGTSAVAHSEANPAVKHVFSKTDADEANAHYADTTLDHHTQYALAAGTRAFTGTTAIAAIVGSSAVGDAAAAGSANTLARSDHVHGREAFGTPTGTARPGASNAAGVATTETRSDHAHATAATGSNTVAASETRSSTAFGDLATVGPTVSSLPTGTLALVILTAAILPAGSGEGGYMGFTVSGATTTGTSTSASLLLQSAAGGDQMFASACFPVTLTAGSNTFTAKYRTVGGTSVQFAARSLVVIPLN